MTHTGHGHHDWNDAARWSTEILMEPALVPVTEALLDAVHVFPGQRLLDLACGLGHTTAAATARGADALGIDLSDKRIAAARARFPEAKFKVADASAPPPGPWDAIVCRFGAHHLSPGWAEALRAVLAPDGRVAIAEWPPRDERDRENGMMQLEHWVTILERAGFRDVQVDAVMTRLAMLAAEDPELARHLVENEQSLADREVLIICARQADGERSATP